MLRAIYLWWGWGTRARVRGRRWGKDLWQSEPEPEPEPLNFTLTVEPLIEPRLGYRSQRNLTLTDHSLFNLLEQPSTAGHSRDMGSRAPGRRGSSPYPGTRLPVVLKVCAVKRANNNMYL